MHHQYKLRKIFIISGRFFLDNPYLSSIFLYHIETMVSNLTILTVFDKNREGFCEISCRLQNEKCLL